MFVLQTLRKPRAGAKPSTTPPGAESRSFSPSALASGGELVEDGGTSTDAGIDDEEEAFFQVPPTTTLDMPAQDVVLKVGVDKDQQFKSHDNDEKASMDTIRSASAVEMAEGVTKIWYDDFFIKFRLSNFS